MRSILVTLILVVAGCTQSPEDDLNDLTDRVEIECGSIDTTCLMTPPVGAVGCLQAALDAGKVGRLVETDETQHGWYGVTTYFTVGHEVQGFSDLPDEISGEMTLYEHRRCKGPIAVHTGMFGCMSVIAENCDPE